MIITMCEGARQLSFRYIVYDVRGQMSDALHALSRTYRESRLDATTLATAHRGGSVHSGLPAGCVRPLRPSVLHSPAAASQPGAERHLFYGSSATSNQRLIIQRGNCATSLYDRATRHVRRRWCSLWRGCAPWIDAADWVSTEHHAYKYKVTVSVERSLALAICQLHYLSRLVVVTVNHRNIFYIIFYLTLLLPPVCLTVYQQDYSKSCMFMDSFWRDRL